MSITTLGGFSFYFHTKMFFLCLFCVITLVSAQSAESVKATYRTFNKKSNEWDLNTSGVLCAAEDGYKSLSWRSEYGWTAFCGPVGPVGKPACGQCLNVTLKLYTNYGVSPPSKTLRIVDQCNNGGLDLDIDVFRYFDSSGFGERRGSIMVDYEFVDCGPETSVPTPDCRNGTHCHNTNSSTLSPTPTPTPTFLSPSPSNSPQQIHPATTGGHLGRIIGIGVGSVLTVVVLMSIIICCFKRKSSIQQIIFRYRKKNYKNIEVFLKDHGALLQKRYKFSEIKKMTNSFKVKLGQGGFGAVYKGMLSNGSLVAVKILNSSKGNGEEFINEVASITRTSHVNVVTLLGFCFEGNKEALIYEFMPNGSLDKLIYNKGTETIKSLSWDNLYQIAKGIARGLEYLHKGCSTRILHFDIKPHNILLDENLCPKISDFGLAKICLRKESIISMSDARGTIGYVAPEVWNRNFGGVSHKSDVYSYGMMLLEMIGGRKNINANASHTSEIYYPHWVYNRLELGSDLRPNEVIVKEEDEIARRMTIVGLWCIQTFPNDRPTITKVIEMLEGSMNSLDIPPKPLLSSPTRSSLESSTS